MACKNCPGTKCPVCMNPWRRKLARHYIATLVILAFLFLLWKTLGG